MEFDERNICLKLESWFKSYDIACWQNFGDNQFNIKGSKKKPDLIIFSNKINQFIVVEVKKGNTSKDIYDSNKIVLKYWNEYTNNISEYFIKGNKIPVSSFAVATYYSMFGKIFEDDDRILGISDFDSEFNKYNKNNKIEPFWEYQRSRDFLRHIWAEWRHLRGKYQPGVGLILSNILNQNEKPTGKEKPVRPLLFDIQFENQKYKSKWQNRQKLL